MKETSPELHEAKPSEEPNKDHDGHNAGGIAWLMGEHLPGPHAPQTAFNALQKVNESVMAYRLSIHEFLKQAGLQESLGRDLMKEEFLAGASPVHKEPKFPKILHEKIYGAIINGITMFIFGEADEEGYVEFSAYQFFEEYTAYTSTPCI